MRLSSKERTRCLEACELLERESERYSCVALEFGFKIGRNHYIAMPTLVDKYGEFYGMGPFAYWDFNDKEERITAVLLFLEANK